MAKTINVDEYGAPLDFWLLCNGKPQLRHVPAAKK